MVGIGVVAAGKVRLRTFGLKPVKSGPMPKRAAVGNIKSVSVDVSGGSEAGQIIQIEVHGQLAADAIIGHAEAAANNRLAIATDEPPEPVVAKIRRPGDGDRRRKVVPVLFVIARKIIRFARQIKSDRIIERHALRWSFRRAALKYSPRLGVGAT